MPDKSSAIASSASFSDSSSSSIFAAPTTVSPSATSNSLTPELVATDDAHICNFHADQLGLIGHEHDLFFVFGFKAGNDRAVALDIVDV